MTAYDARPIMQFEYTNGNNNLVYYDLSEIVSLQGMRRKSGRC